MTDTPRSVPAGASLEPILYQWCQTLLAIWRDGQIVREAQEGANDLELGPLVARQDAQARMEEATKAERAIIGTLRNAMIARCVAEVWPAVPDHGLGYPGRDDADLDDFLDYLSDERTLGRFPRMQAVAADIVGEVRALRALRASGDTLARAVAACLTPHGSTFLWKARAKEKATLLVALADYDAALRAQPVALHEPQAARKLTTEEILTSVDPAARNAITYHALPPTLEWDWVVRTWDTDKWHQGAVPDCRDCERPLTNIHDAIRIRGFDGRQGEATYWHRACAEYRFQTSPEDQVRLWGSDAPITEDPAVEGA